MSSAPDDRPARRLRNLLGLLRRPRPVVGATPCDVVARDNKAELLRYRPRPDGVAWRTPVVMVPSMINRHYVLDLQPGRSLVEHLVGLGHDVYMVRWGTPTDEDRYVTFDDVCDATLGRMIRHAAKRSPRGRAHVLGYCMGGTMAAIHASVRREHVASLATLAAPVRFRDEALLSTWASSETFDVGAMVDALGNAPWPLLQGTFLMQRPTMNLAKLVGMIDRAWDDEWLESFLALETWVNDNVSLPGAAFRDYIERLYKTDGLVAGDVALSGERVRLENLSCPLLAVTFEHDLIVPWRSAAELVERAGSADKERLHLSGGHVGAVVSKKAAAGLWAKLSQWWIARDAEAPAVAAPSPSPAPVADPVPDPVPAPAPPPAKSSSGSRKAPRAQAPARRGKA